MGLDLLPDHLTNSPSHSSSSTLGTPNLPPKSHFHYQHCRPQQPRPLHSKTSSPRNCLDHDFSGTRSLPETPRISSARRSDVEHRLSLQINKENVSEDLVLSRLSSLKRIELKVEEENRSPGHYARQIVKQVKESVSRKVGLDITNTVRNREQTRRRDQELELINQYKSKKILSKAPSSTKIVDVTGNSPGNHYVTTTSCSPRLKFLEPKNKPITTLPCKDHNNNSHSKKPSLLLSQNTKPSTKPDLPQVLLQDQCHHQHQQRPSKNCKKVTEEKFDPPPSRLIKKPLKSSDIIRTNKEDPFVLSTSVTRTNIPDKKTPLSNDLNISLPTLLPVKKDPTPPATKIPQKQVLHVLLSRSFFKILVIRYTFCLLFKEIIRLLFLHVLCYKYRYQMLLKNRNGAHSYLVVRASRTNNNKRRVGSIPEKKTMRISVITVSPPRLSPPEMEHQQKNMSTLLEY